MTMIRSRSAFHGPASPKGLMLLGVGWLTIAATIGYVSVATPLIDRLVLSGRMASASDVLRFLAVVAAAAVPAGLATAGAARLTAAIRIVLRLRTSTVRRLAGQFSPETTVLSKVHLDDRVLPDVVVGRFGVVIFRELPENAAVRHFGGHWEIDVDGEWIPFENPLERTARDAEHLRWLFGVEERGFVVRVYAALVTTAGNLERIPGCAVLKPDQVVPFMAALPPQRTLTADRLYSVVDFLQNR